MTLTTQETLVLRELFELAQSDTPATVIRLMTRTELPRATVEAALARLDRAGWVSREAIRLSLPGLALAVAAGPRARGARGRRLAA